MNLNGWDTTSVIAVPLINEALERNAHQLVTKFRYREGTIRIEGTFGPWRIVPSAGALQMLHVEIPVLRGKMEGLRPKQPNNLAGTVLKVEIGLRFLPKPGAQDEHELMFDLEREGLGAAMQPIRALDITVPKGRLREDEIEVVRLTLVDCLNAHTDQVAFVFASVKARGTAQESWLETTHHDWTSVTLGDGRHFLAILGSNTPPTKDMTPDRFDVGLIPDTPSATFAFSHDLYLQKLMLPWLQESFRPQAQFATYNWPQAGKVIALKKPVALPRIDKYDPVLEQLVFSLTPKGIAVFAKARVHIALGSYLNLESRMQMTMKLDSATGAITLIPDGKPKQKHWFDANNPLGWIVTAIATILEALIPSIRTSITDAITQISRKMQAANNPLTGPKTWTSVRDFRASRMRLEPFLWFADDRPATVKTVVEKETA